MDQLNVFGEVLPICCEEPMTGFTRSGSCETMDQDRGMHTVCAHMTDEPVTEPPQRLVAELKAKGLSPDFFRSPKPGEVLSLSK